MSVTHTYFQEGKNLPHRLGRHQELDSRSLEYAHKESKAAKVAPAEWPVSIPVLDQGDLGSCTGNAGTYAVSHLYPTTGMDTAPDLDGFLLNGKDPKQDEHFAVELYSDATKVDGFGGVYPPNDTGSSGLAVCKALRSRKLIDSYVWALSLRGLVELLQKGPVIIGMPWFNDWFDPDKSGFIDSGSKWEASGVAGGHEVYVEALESYSADRPESSVIRIVNSWGPKWGLGGRFRMHLSTYETLKKQIDVKQMRRG